MVPTPPDPIKHIRFISGKIPREFVSFLSLFFGGPLYKKKKKKKKKPNRSVGLLISSRCVSAAALGRRRYTRRYEQLPLNKDQTCTLVPTCGPGSELELEKAAATQVTQWILRKGLGISTINTILRSLSGSQHMTAHQYGITVSFQRCCASHRWLWNLGLEHCRSLGSTWLYEYPMP